MWQLEDEKFAETTASSNLFLTVRQQDTNVVTVVGPRGCGKSFLTKHIAIKIQQEYQHIIIPVEGLKKVIEWYDPKIRQLFVLDIDNAFHASQLDHTLKKWQNQSERLQSRLDNRSLKMIACCSTDTYENPEFEKISLLHQHKFDIKSDENILSDEDIEAIAARHMKDDEVVVIKEIKEDLKKLDNFPMLCRKFADEKHGNPTQYFAEYMSLAINDTRVENSNSTVDINTSTSMTVNPGQIVQGMFMNSTISNSPMTFNFNINTINKN